MEKISNYILCVLFLMGMGCSDFGDIDKNPNRSATPLTSAMLTSGLSSLGNTGAGGNSLVCGFYAQYFSQTQYSHASLYATSESDWGAEMRGPMMDFQTIINLNSDPETIAAAVVGGSNANQIAIARILKAYWFSLITDRHGEIPYFEALKGKANPKFDAQEDIYNDLFKELDEAVSQFDNGTPVKGDILYNGNNAHWQKFANSFRLILALRVSKVDPQLGKEQFNDALNSPGGVFETNADNAVIHYPGRPFINPWFAIAADQAISATVAEFLNATQDERRKVYGKPTRLPPYNLIGVPYGLKREDAIAFTAANPSWSLILNDSYRTEQSSLAILTYATVLLARAEAAFLGWTNEDEGHLYTEAIRASWEQWQVFDQGAYDAYVANPIIALSPGTEAEKIATQRWLTFYPNGAQGWSEWRRTGFPVLIPTAAAVNASKQIPVRFPYYSAEYNLNPREIAAAVQRMGGDTDMIRVWWDVD